MSDGLTLQVGAYSLPYPCAINIEKNALFHPDTNANIGHQVRWDVTSYTLGASTTALRTAMDAIEAAVAAGQDVKLVKPGDPDLTIHELPNSTAHGGVKFVRPISFPAGQPAQWASNVRFHFSFQAHYYDGVGADAQLLWETQSYEYGNDANGGQRRVWKGEIHVKSPVSGDSAWARAWAKNPGVISGWNGPLARVEHNSHVSAAATKASYEFAYIRGAGDDDEYTQTLEKVDSIEKFVIVEVLDGDPVRQATTKGKASARQNGRRVKSGSYPDAEEPLATWAGEDNANLLTRHVTREELPPTGGQGGMTESYETKRYAVSWNYEFESASNFEFPAAE